MGGKGTHLRKGELNHCDVKNMGLKKVKEKPTPLLIQHSQRTHSGVKPHELEKKKQREEVKFYSIEVHSLNRREGDL